MGSSLPDRLCPHFSEYFEFCSHNRFHRINFTESILQNLFKTCNSGSFRLFDLYGFPGASFFTGSAFYTFFLVYNCTTFVLINNDCFYRTFLHAGSTACTFFFADFCWHFMAPLFCFLHTCFCLFLCYSIQISVFKAQTGFRI